MREATVLLGMVWLLATLPSCQKTPVEAPEGLQRITLSFRAVSDGSETKASFGPKENRHFPLLWGDGDKVGVTVNGQAEYVSAAIVPSADALEGTFTATLTAPASGSVRIQAAAPKSAILGIEPGGIRVGIPSVQTPEALGPDPLALIVYAQQDLDAVPDTPVTLRFNHVTAYGRMSLANLPATETVRSIDIVSTASLAGQWTCQPTTRFLSEVLGGHFITLITSQTQDIFFACAPVALMGKKLTIRVKTDSYIYEKSGFIQKDVSFHAGRVARFTVDMADALRSPRSKKILACWGNNYTNRGGGNTNVANYSHWLQELLGEDWTVYNGGYDGKDLPFIVDKMKEWEASNDADVTFFYMERNGGYANYPDLLARYQDAIGALSHPDEYIVGGSHIRQYWPIAATWPVVLSPTETQDFSGDGDGNPFENSFVAPFRASGKLVDLYHPVVADWKNWLVRTGKYESVAEISADVEYPGTGTGPDGAVMLDTDGDGVKDTALDWPVSFWWANDVHERCYVHPGEYGAKAIALLIYDKMMELGYIATASSKEPINHFDFDVVYGSGWEDVNWEE